MESCNGMCANIKWEQILTFKEYETLGLSDLHPYMHPCWDLEHRWLHNISLDIEELKTFFGNIL